MTDTKCKRILLACLLTLLAACLLLAGCSGDSCISGCALLRSIWTPELSVTENGKTPVPYITGTLSAEEVSAQLSEYYAPVVAVVNTANEGADLFMLEHELVSVEESYYLHSSIVCSVGGRVELPRIYIPYAGETVLPEWSLPEGIEGAKLTAAWLELTANRVSVDLSGLNESVAVPELLETYIEYYRTLSKWEIDTSRFAESIDYDTLCREAMVLNLCAGEFEYSDEDPVDSLKLMEVSTELLSALINDACGQGSAGFSEIDLLETIDVFSSMGVIDAEKWAADSELIGMLIEQRLEELSAQQPSQEITRREIAFSLVNLHEIMYGTIHVDDSWYADSDDDDPACIKASYEGLMYNFPAHRIFAPGFSPGRGLLPVFVNDFLYSCVTERCENIYEEQITRSDVILALSAVDTCVRLTGLSKADPVEVNNSRDYDWYYTQHGTGWFSSVNCMPTITMMATKWYDKDTTVTIEEMRMRYYPEYSDGWYTWQVAECLTENGVPNKVNENHNDSSEKLSVLNDGRLILTQMSEAPDDESGHCFVIYGYWKLGDTVKYYIHDPDVYDGIDEFGQRPGRAMVLDSRYCEWIIDRIAFGYISVGD